MVLVQNWPISKNKHNIFIVELCFLADIFFIGEVVFFSGGKSDMRKVQKPPTGNLKFPQLENFRNHEWVITVNAILKV